MRDEDSRRADRAQELLAERTPAADQPQGATSGAPSGTSLTPGPRSGAIVPLRAEEWRDRAQELFGKQTPNAGDRKG
jgi:hypothetical protein